MQTGLLVAVLLAGAGTAVARDLDMRADRDARGADLLSESGGARHHPEAVAALRMAQGARDPSTIGGVAGLLLYAHRPRQVSVATAGQALLLRLPSADVQLPPNAVLVAHVRAGAPLPGAVWTAPGLAGLVALEAGRAGRVDLVTMLVSTYASGPSVPDRLAAKWALERLGFDQEGRPVAESRATQGAQ